MNRDRKGSAMRGLDEIERDLKVLRSRAKAQADAGLLQVLSSGFSQAGVPSLETLANELRESIQDKHETSDWRTLWRDRAAAAAAVLADCFGVRGGALRRTRD